jgi:hypothetical protein
VDGGRGRDGEAPEVTAGSRDRASARRGTDI